MDLYHKTIGSGEVVVILHGLFGMSDNWRSIAKIMADQYTVVIIDLPNHGRSPRLEEFTIPNVVGALTDFLNRKWMHRVSLIGHSLGAKVAMHTALHNDDLVERLVCVDMAPKSYAPGHQDVFEALHAVDLSVTDRADVEEQLATYLDDHSVILFLMKNLQRAPHGFDWKFDLDVLTRDYANILVGVDEGLTFDGPTLFIKGGASDYIRLPEDESRIKSQFSDATIETIQGAGHWVHAQKKQDTLEVITNFLTRSGSQA